MHNGLPELLCLYYPNVFLTCPLIGPRRLRQSGGIRAGRLIGLGAAESDPQLARREVPAPKDDADRVIGEGRGVFKSWRSGAGGPGEG